MKIQRDKYKTSAFLDSHCHFLKIMERGLPFAEVAWRCAEAGVYFGMDIATDLENIEERRQLIHSINSETRLFGYTLGLYPSFAAAENAPALLEELESELGRRAEDPLLWALGEIGIDHHWNYAASEVQAEFFRSQILIAQKYNLPIVIHNRLADEAILKVLRSSLGTLPAPGIVHCFSSSVEAMQEFIDLGFYISLSGNVTFKNAGELQNVARRIPLDRILFETDSPFLSPVPHRGKTNEPCRVPLVYRRVAELRGVSTEDLAWQVLANFSRAIPKFPLFAG